MKRFLLIVISVILLTSCQKEEGAYVCPPCDQKCDHLTFDKPGICPHCKMTLVKKSELISESDLVLNEINLNKGSGIFLVEGAKGREHKSIKVYYHKPQNFFENSQILWVIPGAGRDADEYRDAWTETSEKFNVLILSPRYEEDQYPFEEYHLCRVMKELNLEESFEFIEGTNQVKLHDEALSFKINANREEWLFTDFDRIFDLVLRAEKSKQTSYDIFGHSAGGQILHRMALLSQGSKANKIIAANSGFYTLPDVEVDLPFGLKGLTPALAKLSESFSNQLIILVGELDNEHEQKGTLLRSKMADMQGTHRLERARYFFEFAKAKAAELEMEFNWEIEIVPKVGHNHKLMGAAAAKLLYERGK